MQLVTYQHGGPGGRVGVVRDGQVVDIEGPSGATPTMLDLIRRGAAGDALSTSGPGVSLSEVSLLAPIPLPVQNIICLGRNYQEHAEEMVRAGRDRIDRPTLFTKAVTSVIGPYDDVPYDPNLTTQLDWEVELACIIGRRARHVRRDEALAYVFGYTVLNDVSARDVQYGYGGQFFLGKSLDGACPLGPWIVTADEIPDPQALGLRLRVNGETKQDARTRDMIFDVAGIIETLSRFMTLEPGQIIATGTPSGVGHARTPPEFLQPGDVMESEVDGIGTLRNTVRQV